MCHSMITGLVGTHSSEKNATQKFRVSTPLKHTNTLLNKESTSHTMPVRHTTADTDACASIAGAIGAMPSYNCITGIQILNHKNTVKCPVANIPTTSKCTHLHWQRKTPYHPDIDATERAYVG